MPKAMSPSDASTTAAEFCTVSNRRFVLIAAILASALGFIDGTIVAIALPAMRDGLDASLTQAQWINNGYLLPLSALILLGGALGDRFGTARSFALGIIIFLVASLACAIAPNAETLIAARVLKGLGAALMIPGSLALIARAYPPDERGKAIGIWAAASSLTTALGPILAGLALEFGGPEIWRWLFGINLPFGAIALWLVLTKIKQDASRPEHPLDLVGAALITVSLGALAWGLTQTPASLPLLAGSALSFGAFLLWETRASDPMVPLSLFKNRSFAVANAATLLIYIPLGTVLFFLPMTLIAGWGVAEALASAAFAPLSIFITLLSALAGRLADKHGAGLMIGAGAILTAVGYALMAALAPMQDFWLSTLPATVLMGLGMALVVSPLSIAVMRDVPEDKTGTASGISNTLARASSLFAVAFMGSLAARLYGGFDGPESFGAFSDALGHAEAMTAAFQSLAWISAALTAIGGALAFLLIPRPQSDDTRARL